MYELGFNYGLPRNDVEVLGIWPYLEIEFFRWSSKNEVIRVAPNQYHCALNEKGKLRHRDRCVEREATHIEDWRYGTTSQGTTSWRDDQHRSFPDTFRGSRPGQHIDIRLPASRTGRQEFLLVLSFPVCEALLWQPQDTIQCNKWTQTRGSPFNLLFIIKLASII